jgi:hypothetical protein
MCSCHIAADASASEATIFGVIARNFGSKASRGALTSSSLLQRERAMAVANFRIVMRWTQKGLDEIDSVADRRKSAIAIMQSYKDSSGARTITFTNEGTSGDTGSKDITYVPDKNSNDKEGQPHVVWTVTGPKDDVSDLADAMQFHGYVKTRVRKA